MAAFRFRLESVLRFREQVRRERKWELGALEQTCGNLASEIVGLEQFLVRESKKLDEQQGEILSVTDLRTQADYCSGLVKSIQKKRELLTDVQGKLALKRDEVIRANQEVKSLERLRERLREKHRLQEKREEQKLADELGQRRHTERNGG